MAVTCRLKSRNPGGSADRGFWDRKAQGLPMVGKTLNYTTNSNTSPRDGAACEMASKFFNMAAIVLLLQSTCCRWGFRFGVE